MGTAAASLARASTRVRAALVLGLSLLGLAAVFVLRSYAPRFSRHGFADTREMLGVPNFMDVVSNLPFLVVGLAGLAAVARPSVVRLGDERERWPWLALFVGVALVAIGSAYYHLAPNDDRLVWDRLPMTIAFTAFLCAIVAERVRVGLGLLLLAVLVPLGVGTVFYWRATGDLRPYMLVQLWPMLLVPALLFIFPPRYTRARDVLLVLGFYVLAKAAEVLDGPIFAAGGVISGHSLKHVLAAAGLLPVVLMLRNREPLAPHE